MVRKVHVQPGQQRQAQAQAQPESQRFGDLPLGCWELTDGPGAPGDTSAGDQERAPQQAAAVRGARPPLLKCSTSLSNTASYTFFWFSPAISIPSPGEPSSKTRGRPQRAVLSLLSERGAARAGWHRAGNDFPRRRDRGQRRFSPAVSSPSRGRALGARA